MATQSLYKGLIIITPRQQGGQLVVNDLKELADRAGPVHQKAGEPNAMDDSNGTAGNGSFYQWSKWYNTSDESIWICVDDTISSAVWKKMLDTANVNMGDLGDVDNTPATTNDVLAWGVSSWAPTSAAKSALSAGAIPEVGLDGLSDVTITGATTNDVLNYNGTSWVNDTSVQQTKMASWINFQGLQSSNAVSPYIGMMLVGSAGGAWVPSSVAPSARSANSTKSGHSADSAWSAESAGMAYIAESASWLRGASTNSSGHVLVYSSGGGGSSWDVTSRVPSAISAEFASDASSTQKAYSASWLRGASTNVLNDVLVFSSGIPGGWVATSRVPKASSATIASSAQKAYGAYSASWLRGASTRSSGHVLVYSSGGGGSSWDTRSYVNSAQSAYSAQSAGSAVTAGSAYIASYLVSATTPTHGQSIAWSSGVGGQNWVLVP